MALIFTGYINDVEEPYEYLAFIDTLREMAKEKKGNAVVNFSLHHDGYEEKTFSPKLKIDFERDCYIHEIAPTEDGTYGNFEGLEIPNYPT